MTNLFTFQVNISPGDILYAGIMVRELAQKHLSIPDRLLIVDCCKPKKTKMIDPDLRFPEPEFSLKVKLISELANQLLKEKLFTSVYFLKPGDEIFKIISKKYLNNIIKSTHGAGATAQMAYWAGIELASTRYVIHYDGDMILYQETGYKWWEEALKRMHLEDNVVMAVPRYSPPTTLTKNLPVYFVGTEIFAKDDYWVHNWFSTRIFLIDKIKLQQFLPLVTGKIFFELLLRKILFRAFPLDPEIILFKKLGKAKSQRRLILQSEKAWTLHPFSKPADYIKILSKILYNVNNNKFPTDQLGNEDIVLNAWVKFCNE